MSTIRSSRRSKISAFVRNGGVVFAGIVVSWHAQGQVKVNGICSFNPPLAKADVQLYLVQDKDTIDGRAAERNNQLYFFKFDREVANNKPVYVKGAVTSHPDYSQYTPAGLTQKWISNPHKVYFARKTDIYANHLGKAYGALGRKEYKAAMSELSFLSANREELALTDKQVFETYLTLGSVAYNAEDYETQLDFLDSASALVPIDELGKARIDRYSREKFHAFLKAYDYNSMMYPINDFPKQISEDPQRLDRWNKLIEDIGKYYGVAPASSPTPTSEDVKSQLQKLAAVLAVDRNE